MSTSSSDNYQVLARTWRPQQLSDVVWQSHVTQALSNALTAKRIHHAYLFTGTRGVGKTTLARIMAKCLVCEEGISATPCDNCDNCVAINNGQFIDLIEVDAASRTRVEDTRELLENAHYAPTQGRFKIYLIDEVHMLSAHSFNALLKTLEEPPEHVKFLFATTDPDRLPATMLSRCLQFHLKAIPDAEIIQRCQTILEKENIQSEAEALALIANAANGSLRDALSLLDQVIDHQNQTVSTIRTRQLLGLADPVLILDIIQAISDKQPQTALITLEQLREQNTDMTSILDQLLGFFHELALAKVVPTQLNQHPQIETLTHLLQQLSAEEIQLYYQIILHGRRDLAVVPVAKHGVEMTLLRLFAFQPQRTPSQATGIPQAQHTVVAKPAAPKVSPKPTTGTTQQEVSEPPAATPSPLDVNTDWPTIANQLPITGVTQTIANQCVCDTWEGNRITLLLDANYSAFLSDVQKNNLQQALSTHFKRPMHLTIEVAKSDIATPAKQKSQAEMEAKNKAEKALNADENVNKLVQAFDATLDADSIEAK